MAPLTFGDKINLYSMIGTWLGTFFTLVGLAAVIAQLRTLLKDFSNSQDEIVKAAAGDWAICLPRLRRSDTGVIEGKVPSLRGWILDHYNEDKSITVCAYENRQASGQSSCSQLFYRLRILPEDLVKSGHRVYYHDRTIQSIYGPTTADILVDGSNISYGLPGDDFAALLILGGFTPSGFNPKETTKTTSHLGHIYLAARDDPFSQIARLDSGSWNILNTFPGSKWEGRHADRLNVRHCLDLALGILRFDCGGKPKTLLYCVDDATTMPSAIPDLFSWSRPSVQQALNIRRNLFHLTGGSMEVIPLYDITTTAFPKFSQLFSSPNPVSQRLSFDFSLIEDDMNYVFEIAFGIIALKPWGLLAVIPQSIVLSYCCILNKLFVEEYTTPSSTPTLILKFRELPAAVRYNVPHRTKQGMDSAIESLCNVPNRNFSGLSSRCSLYYDAMIFVFKNNNLRLEDVEISLAAYCAVSFATSSRSYSQLRAQALNFQRVQWEIQFRAYVRECLNGSPVDEVELWACDILATYLHAWLQEAKDIKSDFLSNFRRRVFLG